MPEILPIPPQGTPYLDSTGNLTEPWRRYLQSIEDALSSATAPSDAQYWVSTTNTGLTNERNFGVLGSGYVKSTVAALVSTPSTVATIPASDISSGAALTRTNDTNVTLTLGGTPTTALLAATSITVGWSGTLGLSRGGTNANLSATGGSGQVLKQSSAGAAVTVGTLAITDTTGTLGLARGGTNADLSATGGSGQVLKQASAGATITVGQVAYADVTGTPNLTNSTYTPTDSNNGNLTACTPGVATYARVGDIVTVAGVVTLDITSSGADTSFHLSLPIASSSSNINGVGVSGFDGGVSTQQLDPVSVSATGTGAAHFIWWTTISGDVLLRYTFQYQVT